MDPAYNVRLCDVSSTAWRRSQDTRPSEEFDLTQRFQNFYESFEGQLPELLAQHIFGPHDVTLRLPDGQVESAGDFSRVEVVLFSLPFPANQIVATLVLDFITDELTDEDDSFLSRLLKASSESRIHVADVPIEHIVDGLAQSVRATLENPADPAESPADGAKERHALVFVDGSNLPSHPDQVIAGILYGIQWPYRPEFTQLKRPEALNREAETFAAVSQHSSFFYGQQGEVENSVLLTTVQAVGTAARFQRIWRDAYFQVHQFQANKQAQRSGQQTRRDLETLADEMGNLEFDLAFSVETAADLGLGSTTSRVDAFHRDLYEVMQIKTRAHTVGQMFVRLSSSIRSELTAIESREKTIEDDRRFRGALTLGVLSFILAPVGLVLAFFGVNASQVEPRDSMFDLDRYWSIYLLAIALMIAPAVFAITFDRAALSRGASRWRERLPFPRRRSRE